MSKFHELRYTRPDYKREKEILLDYKSKVMNATSYEDIRCQWLSLRENVQRLEYMEELAYIRYLCGMSNDFYKKEVEFHNSEDPYLQELQNECDNLLLNSSYIQEFRFEFGDMIVNQLNNKCRLSNSQTTSLQTKESNLKTEYISLLSSRHSEDGLYDKVYDILDSLIRVRTEIAKKLGFRNYIEMAYKIHGRFDYGEKELTSFRSQIQKMITPACNELRKVATIKYPDTNNKDASTVFSIIKDMLTDLSTEGGEYINHILEHEFYDISDRPNKRQNYFGCCMLPDIKLPFMIGSYHGNGLEANYLIHEFGHGYAFYTAARCQKLFEYHRASTSVNEIHSKTMEHLAYPYLERILGKQMNLYVRNHLFHSFDNLPYRCAIDEFEHAIYDDISMSRSKRCELWADIEEKYMPWRVKDSDAIKRGTYFPNQSHLFTHPFYYIEYNIAQISVLEFYERSKHNWNKSCTDYSNLCKAGGSTNYLNLLKIGNLSNPFSQDNVTKICKPVLDELFTLI